MPNQNSTKTHCQNGHPLEGENLIVHRAQEALDFVAAEIAELKGAPRSHANDPERPADREFYVEKAQKLLHGLAAISRPGLVLDREDKHSVQRDVEDFHRALDVPVFGDSPAIRRPGLRADLIREEARETVEAIERGDLVEAIDGMCDVLCVVYGTAAEFGIDLAPFWDEVHRTNMAKQGGPVRVDGKRLKPPGWTPPDIAGILARFLAVSEGSEDG